MMEDYEAMILDSIDAEIDYCETCEYNPKNTGEDCHGKCEELETSVNPVIAAMLAGTIPESL